jgi:hypothetical protein
LKARIVSMQNPPKQLVAEFLHEYRINRTYSRERIARLATMTVSDNSEVAESATRAFFTGLVEPLADSFEPADVTLYNRLFAQVIQTCRADPRASAIDGELNAVGLTSEKDLIARAETLRATTPLSGWRDWAEKLRRVIVLSRVTLGADVAVTSVIINRLKDCLPVPQTVIGGAKLKELFGGDAGLSFREINYARSGTMIERLLAWLDLLTSVREATADLKTGEFVIFDPDTRLTQLGLVPLVQVGSTDSRTDYLFFPSREFGGGGSQALAELTSLWLDRVFDQNVRTHPFVSLRPVDTEAARNLTSRFNPENSRPIVTMNFGVGENPAKCLGDEFEQALVMSMIQHGAIVILDKGASGDEIARADRIVRAASRIEHDGRGLRVVELDERSLASLADSVYADLVTWNGRIGLLAALIAKSDLYIGYDSAGQHIAAGLGVPCIDVFAGFTSERFVHRWSPAGAAETRVVTVDAGGGSGELAELVTQHAITMLQRTNFKS